MPSIESARVGAVIDVEAAQEVLVGLAAAGVLHEHETGRDAQDVLHAADRAQREVAIATENDDAALIGRRA